MTWIRLRSCRSAGSAGGAHAARAHPVRTHTGYGAVSRRPPPVRFPQSSADDDIIVSRGDRPQRRVPAFLGPAATFPFFFFFDDAVRENVLTSFVALAAT